MKTTNGEFFKSLSNEEKIKFREQYGKHPLREFIDWQAFYNSESGDEMDFVRCIKKDRMVIDDTFKDEETQEEENVIILLEFEDDDTEYQLVYAIEDGIFYKIPKPTPVTLIPEEFGGEPDEEILPDDEFDESDFLSEE